MQPVCFLKPKMAFPLFLFVLILRLVPVRLDIHMRQDRQDRAEIHHPYLIPFNLSIYIKPFLICGKA